MNFNPNIINADQKYKKTKNYCLHTKDLVSFMKLYKNLLCYEYKTSTGNL